MEPITIGGVVVVLELPADGVGVAELDVEVLGTGAFEAGLVGLPAVGELLVGLGAEVALVTGFGVVVAVARGGVLPRPVGFDVLVDFLAVELVVAVEVVLDLAVTPLPLVTLLWLETYGSVALEAWGSVELLAALAEAEGLPESIPTMINIMMAIKVKTDRLILSRVGLLTRKIVSLHRAMLPAPAGMHGTGIPCGTCRCP